jgi:lactoylglutathione lyase
MKIDHLAIWVNNLEAMKQFYVEFFNMKCSNIYENPNKGFTSYFLSFEDGARIELMHRNDITEMKNTRGLVMGITHFSISVGSKQKVDAFTDLIRASGYTIHGQPRTTGDGYYESVILDPEGNLVEITE